MLTKRTRRVLFWISVTVFAVTVIPLVLFAFGYRFSFEEWKWLPAGGLFVSARPSTNVNIYVDGELVKQTSVISRTLFSQGLTPKTYNVRMERDGYFIWEKPLEVHPARVTEARALLIKKQPDNFEILLYGDYDSAVFLGEDTAFIGLSNPVGESYFSTVRKEIVTQPVAIVAATSTLPESAEKILKDKGAAGWTHDKARERLLWWKDNRLWIAWLKGEDFLPHYASESEMLVMEASHPIRIAEFYPNEEALLVAFSNTLTVVELDGRGKRNIYPLYKGKEPNPIIDADNKIVYFLDDGNLISIPLE